MVLPGIIGEARKAGSRTEPAQLECDRELCTLCGGCAPLCPVDALAVFETYLDIDRKRCTACGACAPGCPTGALRLADREEGRDNREECRHGCQIASPLARRDDKALGDLNDASRNDGETVVPRPSSRNDRTVSSATASSRDDSAERAQP